MTTTLTQPTLEVFPRGGIKYWSAARRWLSWEYQGDHAAISRSSTDINHTAGHPTLPGGTLSIDVWKR